MLKIIANLNIKHKYKHNRKTNKKNYRITFGEKQKRKQKENLKICLSKKASLIKKSVRKSATQNKHFADAKCYTPLQSFVFYTIDNVSKTLYDFNTKTSKKSL